MGGKVQALSLGDVVVPDGEQNRWVVTEVYQNRGVNVGVVRELNPDGTYNFDGNTQRLTWTPDIIAGHIIWHSLRGSPCTVVGKMRQCFVE